MRKTKIIATLGPKSRSEKQIERLIKAGVNVFRINLSHGIEEIYTEDIKNVQKIRERMGASVSIMIDTRGPEIRVKTFENNQVELKKGEIFKFTSKNIVGNDKIVSITQPVVIEHCKIGKTILANDGRIKLKVIEKTADEIVCKVVLGGVLSNNKGLTFVGQTFPLEFVGEKDRFDLEKTLALGAEYISASFVNSKQDILEMKQLTDKIAPNVKIIAKIESQQGIKNLDEILSVCDGVMVARGDLGVEMSFDMLPIAQKTIIEKAKKLSKISIVATEMLESMIKSSRPTRAEISDVASAVFAGASAVMLSAESAVGHDPVLCVQTMARIANTIENSINYKRRFEKEIVEPKTCAELIVSSAVSSSFSLKCKAIVTYTDSGNNAILLCTKRAYAPIVAITNSKYTFNQLAMLFNCVPVYKKNSKDIFASAQEVVKSNKIAKQGDLIIVTTGSTDEISNVLKFQYVE